MKKKWIIGSFILAMITFPSACIDQETLTLPTSAAPFNITDSPQGSDTPPPTAPFEVTSTPQNSDYPNPVDYPNPSGDPVPTEYQTPIGLHEQTPLTLTEVTLPAGYGAESSWIGIYFTDPTSPLASQETGGVDEKLVRSIDSARLTLDVAIYNISLRSVRDAIIRAHERGVQVRLVMESSNRDGFASQAMQEAGIQILGDRREGLMHNKFVVIDRTEIWLGSLNFTYSGTFEENNNLIHIRSPRVAENYTKEFEEMFVDDKFGGDIVAATPNQVTVVENTVVETYFSPDDGVAAHIFNLLKNASESIYFMAFSFTSDEIGAIIREKAAEGLAVAGVMDAEQVKINIGTEFDPFTQTRLDVYLDGNQGFMHHKVMIIDEEIVITGSYNFSRSAEIRNDENMIFIYSSEIAEFFMREFEKVYTQAQR